LNLSFRNGLTGNGHNLSSRTSSHLVSGHETPHHYEVEETPKIFSRNDSLSSFDTEDETPNQRGTK
jgi:hypothetical protein